MSTPAATERTGSGFGLAPPVLPAFLITGAFIAVAVTLFAWRHFRWQRRDERRRRSAYLNRQRGLADRHIPKLWDVWVNHENETSASRQSSDWNTVMPLAATPVPRNTQVAPVHVTKSNDNPNPPPPAMSTYQVACVVQMPQMAHHKPRQSSDTMTSNSEYAIGVAVCETPGQGLKTVGVSRVAKPRATPVLRQGADVAAFMV